MGRCYFHHDEDIDEDADITDLNKEKANEYIRYNPNQS